MTDLKPILKPLKGWFGGNSSLCDIRYDIKEGKPIASFSIAIANVGKGPLHIILGKPQTTNGKIVATEKHDPPTTNGKIVAPATQRIFNDENGYRDEDVGFFERHEHTDHGMTIVHWHYDHLATIEIINDDGESLGESEKEGYCVADSFKYANLPNSPNNQKFDAIGCIQKTETGLSIGWADHYDFDSDDQYIKIHNIPSGKYILRFTVNKTKFVCDIEEPQELKINIDHEAKKVESIDEICKPNGNSDVK